MTGSEYVMNGVDAQYSVVPFHLNNITNKQTTERISHVLWKIHFQDRNTL